MQNITEMINFGIRPYRVILVENDLVFSLLKGIVRIIIYPIHFSVRIKLLMSYHNYVQVFKQNNISQETSFSKGTLIPNYKK